MKRNFRLLMFLSTIFISAQYAFGATATTEVATNYYRLEKEVGVLQKSDSQFELVSDQGVSILFGCQTKSDTIDWPKIKEEINNIPVYNSPSIFELNADVGPMTKDDFYCDTFSGKGDASLYQVRDKLVKNIGKKLKIVADVVVSVVLRDELRIETVTITKIQFYSGSVILTEFSGRPNSRKDNALSSLTTTHIF